MKTNKPVIVLWMPVLLIFIVGCLCGAPTPRPDLKVDPTELPSAQLGIPYEQTIQVSQNVTPVYTISIKDGKLPDGLALTYTEHNDFAKITGIPKEAGSFDFVVTIMCLGTSVNGQVMQVEYAIVVK
jgi:hypothetical protein